MNFNVSGADTIVSEYLLYRGFTQSFQCLEVEKGRDRTKKFEVTRIVDNIFHSLVTFDIESFIQLWDFLSKRFFLHLDTEHMQLSGQLKSDLIKFYLVNAARTKNRDKIGEFFSMYSHEILAENGNYIPGNLRGWFVLPYMEDPDKDGEFAVYFSNRWAELLKITLQNFLSVVLSTAPAPKLLILEKWFRSEAQQEIRTQLKLSAKKIDALIERIENYEVRLQSMRDAVKSLVGYLHKVNISGNGLTGKSTGGGLFETDEEMEGRCERVRELGQNLVKLSTECAKRNSSLGALPPAQRQREILGAEYNALNVNESDILNASSSGNGSSPSFYLSSHSPRELEEMEMDLIQKINQFNCVQPEDRTRTMSITSSKILRTNDYAGSPKLNPCIIIYGGAQVHCVSPYVADVPL